MTESDERTVHRLEAFSDIVIGFSLAQLGASLAFTKSLTLDAPGVIAFLLAFAIICSLWYFHHRLFDGTFFPRTWPVILNFAWLAVVVLLVFVAQQIPKHFVDRNVDQLYFGLYACAYGILAAQSWIGLGSLPASESRGRHRAYAQRAYMIMWSSVFLAALGIVTFVSWTPVKGLLIDAVFVAGGAGNIVLGRYLSRLQSVPV